MSTHPNTILMAVLKPEDLPMKTFHAIAEHIQGDTPVDGTPDDVTFELKHKHTSRKINCSVTVMQEEYDEGLQISSDPGDIVVWGFVTYGYGERINWRDLDEWKLLLELWVSEVCQEYNCSYQIYVTANYW